MFQALALTTLKLHCQVMGRVLGERVEIQKQRITLLVLDNMLLLSHSHRMLPLDMDLAQVGERLLLEMVFPVLVTTTLRVILPRVQLLEDYLFLEDQTLLLLEARTRQVQEHILHQ